MEKKEIKHLTTRKIVLIAILISILFTGTMFAFYYYQQTKLITSISTKFSILSQEIEETKQILQAQIEVETETIREEMNQKDDFLLTKILETEAKSAEEIQKAKQEITGLELKLKDVQISSADFSGIIEDVIPSVMFIRTDVGSGSGVILDKDGLVLTNYHVIKGARYGQANDYKGNIFPISILGFDEEADLAVLTIKNGKFNPLSFGDSDLVNVGQKVIAVGNPGGFSFTVTEGIISAAHRIGPSNIPYLQHDVAINPGNSGGPLISASGEIVGINTLKASGLEGIGFAIESNKAKRVYQEILSEAIEAGTYEPE